MGKRSDFTKRLGFRRVMGTGAAKAYLANLGKTQRYRRDVYEKLSALSHQLSACAVLKAESQ